MRADSTAYCSRFGGSDLADDTYSIMLAEENRYGLKRRYFFAIEITLRKYQTLTGAQTNVLNLRK